MARPHLSRLLIIAIVLLLAGGLTPPRVALGQGAAPTPTAGYTYTIKRGDSWLKIARQTGVPLAVLKTNNPQAIHPQDWLYEGERLFIPGAAGGAAVTPAQQATGNAGFWYQVKAGDAWGTVAKANGVSTKALLAANPSQVQPNRWLFTSQWIWIPGPDSPVAPAQVSVTPTRQPTETPSPTATPEPTAVSSSTPTPTATVEQRAAEATAVAPESVDAVTQAAATVASAAESAVVVDSAAESAATVAAAVNSIATAAAIAQSAATSISVLSTQIALLTFATTPVVAAPVVATPAIEPAATALTVEPTAATIATRTPTVTAAATSTRTVTATRTRTAAATALATRTPAGSSSTVTRGTGACLIDSVIAANQAFDRWGKDGFLPAIKLYQAALADTTSKACSKTANEVELLRDYSRFRLLVAFVASGDAQDAEPLHAQIKDAKIKGAADTFLSGLESSGSIVQSCRDVTEYVKANPTGWRWLTELGLPGIPAQVCPLG